jgi:hypothetical protein
MINRPNVRGELDRVNMFIRALSVEMAREQAKGAGNTFPNAVAAEMSEALYELRLRKLMIVALVNSDRASDDTTSH